MFGEVVGRVSVLAKGKGGPFSEWVVLRCVVESRLLWVIVVVVVVVVRQTVGSISCKTLAYDCLYTLELYTASMIATS